MIKKILKTLVVLTLILACFTTVYADDLNKDKNLETTPVNNDGQIISNDVNEVLETTPVNNDGQIISNDVNEVSETAPVNNDGQIISNDVNEVSETTPVNNDGQIIPNDVNEVSETTPVNNEGQIIPNDGNEVLETIPVNNDGQIISNDGNDISVYAVDRYWIRGTAQHSYSEEVLVRADQSKLVETTKTYTTECSLSELSSVEAELKAEGAVIKGSVKYTNTTTGETMVRVTYETKETWKEIWDDYEKTTYYCLEGLYVDNKGNVYLVDDYHYLLSKTVTTIRKNIRKVAP